jgi:hypothetical protein
VTVRRILALVFVGMLGGILSGLFGAGGGIIMVPLLTILAGMDHRRASATSLIAIVPTSIVGAITYGVAGHLDVVAGIAIAAGGIAGSLIGARLLHTLSIGWLRWLFLALRLHVELSEVRVDEAVRLYEQGWSRRAVGRHLDVANKTIRRVLDGQTVALRSRDRVVAVGWRRDAAGLSAECAPTRV